jgi:hypothetical protein
MQQIFRQPLGMEWLRYANKYLENLNVTSVSEYGTITVIRNVDDSLFSSEFDYIVSNMGL